MILTKNFTLHELVKSNTALRLGINNTPTKEGVIKLRLLAANLLQPIEALSYQRLLVLLKIHSIVDMKLLIVNL